jgi:predicted nuclease with RNAse H fold
VIKMSRSHEWIEREMEMLRKKYAMKVILVRECEVIKVFDTDKPLNLRDLFREAEKLCEGKDWSWAYIPSKNWEMILCL